MWCGWPIRLRHPRERAGEGVGTGAAADGAGVAAHVGDALAVGVTVGVDVAVSAGAAVAVSAGAAVAVSAGVAVAAVAAAAGAAVHDAVGVGVPLGVAVGATPPGSVPMASGLNVAAVATPFASTVTLTGSGALSSAPQPRLPHEPDSRAARNVNRFLPVPGTGVANALNCFSSAEMRAMPTWIMF